MPDHRKHLLLVLLVFSVFRLWGLETLPAWDWDEGYNLNYALNLSGGRLLWFCIKYAFVPHPPLYLLLLAALVKSFGDSILVLRLFTFALNLAILLLVYLVGREVAGEKTGILSSFLYSIYPSAIYWGRIGFSNHLLSLLVVLSLYSFLRHLRSQGRWWIPCCLSAGLSAVTEPQGLVVAFAILLYFLVREKARLFPAAALLFGFFIAFVVYMYTSSPYFMEDVSFQFQRFNILRPQLILTLPVVLAIIWKRREISAFAYQMFDMECRMIFGGRELLSLFYVPISLLSAHFLISVTLLRPLTEESLFQGGDYYWFGVIGLLFLGRLFMNAIVILYFFPSFVSVLIFGRSDHMLIPLYPFFALGLAVLFQELYGHLRPRVGAVFAALLLAYPLPFVLYNDYSAYVQGGVLPSENLKDVGDVTAYVASHTGPDDFIITTTNLARYFQNATCITQAIVYEGHKIEYYHGKYPPDRFAFNCSYRNADYAVVPSGMVGWFMEYAPEASREIGGWDVVNRSGGFFVLHKPTSV